MLQLCKRGRVHIFKYLEIQAIKLDRKAGINNTTLGTLGRNNNSNTRRPCNSTKTPTSHFTERLKQKRHNVDSGYSTSSDFDKRWSQDLTGW